VSAQLPARLHRFAAWSTVGDVHLRGESDDAQARKLASDALERQKMPCAGSQRNRLP